jgi:hypothetical protein
MAEVLSELAIFQTQIAARQSVHGGDCAATILRVCRSHEELRTRLESVEAARRDAQESRFALIIQNEELGAELAATRTRLESVEVALHFYANEDNWFPGVGINRGLPCSVEADEGKIARTALATANDGNTG